MSNLSCSCRSISLVLIRRDLEKTRLPTLPSQENDEYIKKEAKSKQNKKLKI